MGANLNEWSNNAGGGAGPMDEERYQLGSKQVLFLHGGIGAWVIWFDRQNDFDGIQIGAGMDREQAINAAMETLLNAVRTLRALRSRGSMCKRIG